MTPLSLALTKSTVPRCAITSRLRERWKLKSKSSSDGWGILFSHPADFTPVCTTELGAFANRKDEFAQRNAKLIGVSVDSVESHQGWSKDIAET
jgi:alkyl hydroperoxide reductase subunit AhpC